MTMKGIMFNDKYNLEKAVLNGTKKRTWRADKRARYDVGEIVAIKQSYCKVYGENKEFLESKVSTDILINEIFTSSGWRNKMFVKNELMPHQIRITAVKKCRLQDLTDIDCMNEGIEENGLRFFRTIDIVYGFRNSNNNLLYITPKKAFAGLIDRLKGKDYWDINPDGYAYEFELVE